MKTKILKAVYFLIGMLLLNGPASASVGDKFDKFVGSEFSNYQGLYIIAGIVVASLVLYVIVNHFNKQEERKSVHHGTHVSHHRHHRHHQHHQHKVIKKTS
jgi:hypothetical protein